ncbi:MAG: hypothetical protein GOV01_01475 [Candidatus Altiarchaeota archaeon]|nr:hypothetical protein [Candidatus Altiarchaeota archaeon]
MSEIDNLVDAFEDFSGELDNLKKEVAEIKLMVQDVLNKLSDEEEGE